MVVDQAGVPVDVVRANVESTGYPRERIHCVQGMVEDTLPDRAPERIALLRLDTDWYESTKHELEQLYPRPVEELQAEGDDEDLRPDPPTR